MAHRIKYWIAENKISQIQNQIKAETDDSVLKVLKELLAKELEKLAAIKAAEHDPSQGSGEK